MMYLMLDSLVERCIHQDDEDFRTVKQIIPPPYSPDMAHRLFKILLNFPKNMDDAYDIAMSTEWTDEDGGATIRFLCDSWTDGKNPETRLLILNILKTIKEKHPTWFDAECPADVERLISIETEEPNPISVEFGSHSLSDNQVTNGINTKNNEFQPFGLSYQTDDSYNWRLRSSGNQPAPLFINTGESLLSPIGNVINQNDQPDDAKLIESSDKCFEIIRPCDRSTALVALQSFEDRFREGRLGSDTCENDILMELLKFFVEGEDLENSERVLPLLDHFDTTDGSPYALVMQVKTGGILGHSESLNDSESNN